MFLLMNRLQSCTRSSALVWVALFVAAMSGCSKGPTTPTSTTSSSTTTTVPIADAPSITCATLIQARTITADAVVTYPTPSTQNGESPVSVACTPESGTKFPVGETRVDCTARDNRDRTATCSIIVRVSKAASLSRTRFLAFGDSLTAGEVTFPGGIFPNGAPSIKLVLVPSAAYPTILAKNLITAYPLQEDKISVANYGQSGEKAANARDRFFIALNVVRPEAVLILEGANDIPLGEDGAASSAAREIRIMAAEARNRGMRVFLANLPPGRSGNRQIRGDLLLDYNNRMFDVARTEGAVFVDIFSSLSTNVNLYIGADGLHPTEAGYARMAETFQAAIRTALESQ
jgi:lysophospholipase L1-like esterase